MQGDAGLQERHCRVDAALDYLHDPEAYGKREELTAMDISCDA